MDLATLNPAALIGRSPTALLAELQNTTTTEEIALFVAERRALEALLRMRSLRHGLSPEAELTIRLLPTITSVCWTLTEVDEMFDQVLGWFRSFGGVDKMSAAAADHAAWVAKWANKLPVDDAEGTAEGLDLHMRCHFEFKAGATRGQIRLIDKALYATMLLPDVMVPVGFVPLSLGGRGRMPSPKPHLFA